MTDNSADRLIEAMKKYSRDRHDNQHFEKVLEAAKRQKEAFEQQGLSRETDFQKAMREAERSLYNSMINVRPVPISIGFDTIRVAVDESTDDEDDEEKVIEVPKPEEILKKLDEFVIGHQDAKKTLAIAAYYHYHRCRKKTENPDIKFHKSNICLIGATGTGKTLLLSTLAEVLNVPFCTVDATELTPDGYVGTDVGSFVNNITAKEGQDPEQAIIFIDEADKLSKRNVGSSDFKTTDIQKALLKLVEGKVAGSARGMSGGNERLNTTQMLFVIGGAFSGITHKTDFKGKGSVTHEDIIKYGLMPEFVGRFPIITTLDPLGFEDLVTILTAPKDSVITEFIEIFKEHDAELIFHPEALRVIAKVAFDMRTGARALRGVVERVLFDDLYELPQKTKTKIEITEDLAKLKLNYGELKETPKKLNLQKLARALNVEVE